METWTWRGTTWPGGTGRIEVGDVFGSPPNTFTILSITFPWPTYDGFFCEISGITPSMSSIYTAANGRRCGFSGSCNYTKRCIVNAVTVEGGYDPNIGGIGTNWQSQIYEKPVTQPYTGTLTPTYSPYGIPSYTFTPTSKNYTNLATQIIDDGFVASPITPGKAGFVNTWRDGELIRLEFSQGSPTPQWYHVYGGESLETLETIDEYVRHTEPLTAAAWVPSVDRYFWRVDSRILLESGTWLVTTGDVGGFWEYSVYPKKPINPSPADAVTDLTLDQETISWESGSGEGASEETYNVYYGESGDLSLVSEEQADLSFTIQGIDLGSPFDYKVSRSWRIDAVNEYGTTTGDTWTFTTLGFDPPLPHYTLIADPPDFTYGDGVNYGGTEGVDWYWDGYNFIRTSRKLVAAAKDTIWYEEQV